MQFDEEKIRELAAEKIAADFHDDAGISDEVSRLIKARVERIFAERAEAQISEIVDAAIKDGFEREYIKRDAFGKAEGAPTSIRKELERLVSTYWSENVDHRTGKPTDSTYSSVSRAEYLMTQICAEDFSKRMKDAAISVTGHLKDGLRGQMAKQMDSVLNDLFRVKSLQDQGKVEKPY